MTMMVNLLSIAIGGALGTLVRFYINHSFSHTLFPLGTLIENISGSFLLGGLTGLFLYLQVREWVRVGLGVGFCGGFTTMSTFAVDTLYLLEGEAHFQLVGYIFGSLFGGLIMAAFGLWLGHLFGKQLFKSRVKDETP